VLGCGRLIRQQAEGERLAKTIPAADIDSCLESAGGAGDPPWPKTIPVRLPGPRPPLGRVKVVREQEQRPAGGDLPRPLGHPESFEAGGNTMASHGYTRYATGAPV